MQVSDANPMVGIEGRAQLLQRLGGALKEGKEFFGGGDNARLGNLLGMHSFKPNQEYA